MLLLCVCVSPAVSQIPSDSALRERSSGLLSARWRRRAAPLRSSAAKPHRPRPNCDVTAAPSGSRHAGARCWVSCSGNSHLRRDPAGGAEPCAASLPRRTAAALKSQGMAGPETQKPPPHSGSETASRPSSAAVPLYC